MQFLRGNQVEAVHVIAAQLCEELFAGKRVLWLISGGSNIALEVEIMKMVHDHATERLAALAIIPMDERYGKPGHANSNVQQLREAGFEPGEATLVDVLTHDVPFEQTVSFYNDVAATAFASAGTIVGQFGLGTDGHVAGILPDSPATAPGSATVIGYEWRDYIRMTLAAEMFKQVSVGYVLAYGNGKKEAIQRLQQKDESFEKLPAKVLYEIAEVYVYNDFIENKE